MRRDGVPTSTDSAPSESETAWRAMRTLASGTVVEIPARLAVTETSDGTGYRLDDVALVCFVLRVGDHVCEPSHGVGQRRAVGFHMGDGEEMLETDLDERFALALKLFIGFFAAGIERGEEHRIGVLTTIG